MGWKQSIKRILIPLIKWGVSGGLVFWLFHRIGGEKILSTFTQVNGGWILAGFFLFLFSHFLGAYQWQVLLKSEKIEFPYSQVLMTYFIGLFFNNFLIGGVGGDLFRVMDVRQNGKKGTSAVSTVFLDRMMGFFVMSWLSVLALFFKAHGLGHFFWTILLWICIGWILVLFFFLSKRFAKLFTWIVKPFFRARFQVKLRDVYRKIYRFTREKDLVFHVGGISFFTQSARIFTHYLIGRALGVCISPIYYFLFIPIIAIMASLPITIGGIGLREQTGVILLGIVGVIPEKAVAIEFLSYLIAIATSLPGGVFFAIKDLKRENLK